MYSSQNLFKTESQGKGRLVTFIQLNHRGRIWQGTQQGRPFSSVSKLVHNNHTPDTALSYFRRIILASTIPER